MTESDIKSILLEHYSFEIISELNLLKGGVSNHNYQFSDGNKKYVVRVCLFESKNQIDLMIPFLNHAKAVNYPAPRLVSTSNGRDYVIIQDIPILVTTYMEGVSANNLTINTKHIKSLAKLVAGFHAMNWSPPNEPLTLDPDYIFGVYDKLVEYHPSDKDKDSLQMIELVDHYYEKFKAENFTDLTKTLPQGITHGDINLGNVLIKGDEAVSLLDFEEIGRSWQLQDVAMVLVTWTFPNGEPDKELIRTFLNEYELHRPMVKIEKENIIRATEFIAFRQCVYAKSMMSKGRMESAKDFSSYRTLLYLYENGLRLDNICHAPIILDTFSKTHVR